MRDQNRNPRLPERETDAEKYRQFSRYAHTEQTEHFSLSSLAGGSEGSGSEGSGRAAEDTVKQRHGHKARHILIALLAVLAILAAALAVVRFAFPAFWEKEAGHLTRLLHGEQHLEDVSERVWDGFLLEDATEEMTEAPELGVASQEAGFDIAAFSAAANAEAEARAAADWRNLPEISFTPAPTENTLPSRLIAETAIEVNGEVLEDESAFSPWYQIDFGYPAAYTDAEGVITFRGDNFRSDPTYGTADSEENTIAGLWNHTTGALTYGSATWTGSGWTGQPLLVRWPKETSKTYS